jgi:hypothetical protein
MIPDLSKTDFSCFCYPIKNYMIFRGAKVLCFELTKENKERDLISN